MACMENGNPVLWTGSAWILVNSFLPLFNYTSSFRLRLVTGGSVFTRGFRSGLSLILIRERRRRDRIDQPVIVAPVLSLDVSFHIASVLSGNQRARTCAPFASRLSPCCSRTRCPGGRPWGRDCGKCLKYTPGPSLWMSSTVTTTRSYSSSRQIRGCHTADAHRNPH